MSVPYVTLTNGKTLKVGDACYAYSRPRCRPARWRSAVIVEVLPGGGVDRAMVKDQHGRRIVGRYNLRAKS